MPQEEIDWFMSHLFDKDPLTARRDNLPTAMTAPLVMTVSETTATMVAATMMMAMLARFLQSSAVDFQTHTGGSVSIDLSSQ
jgi:hypothetical protein